MNEFRVDGSWVSWLVYADYLDDNELDGSIIRELVEDLQTNQWYWESRYRINNGGFGVGSDYGVVGVGYVGGNSNDDVGSIGFISAGVSSIDHYGGTGYNVGSDRI